ncbi:hypothetical protein NBRC3257_1285 [Gluconobacter thailandicus NBRC 3257]|uniref:Transposase n=1 Tax=Gluconobacter thailandicus NBRC 3257 TaxID=1381097 RepID=A0ABQ0IVP9_GLUTH|nr:hypothetical protein NBRC3255_1369 [Gluconobacter thailandicus NBRC 3255]GAD26286.1 hypothetical protein NBRC3257_1285 [Gluconobacter thailandicus NBRC 3257]
MGHGGLLEMVPVPDNAAASTPKTPCLTRCSSNALYQGSD